MPDPLSQNDCECVFDDFEAAWDSGERPVIEDYLVRVVESDREQLLTELLQVELWWRREETPAPDVSAYENRFVDLTVAVHAAFAAFNVSASDSCSVATNGLDKTTLPLRRRNQSESIEPTLPLDGDFKHASAHPVRDSGASKNNGSKSGSEARALNPTSFGRYRVDELLGRGGFGEVYKAWDDQLRRPVAVKVTLKQFVTSKNEESFLAEARTVARLDHDHIVPVYDVGQAENGDYFVVSKLITGKDLSGYLKEHEISTAEAVEVVATIADALHYAHQMGLVHRDVKPANILIDEQGKAYLTDFGIALSDDDIGKGPGLIGTPGYMSPEQVSGESHRVDGRTDIFSLAVVLYELLTGKRPFRSKSRIELMKQISSMEAKPPRQINDEIPAALERVCLKALSKDMNERYSTAKDFSNDLTGPGRDSAPASAGQSDGQSANRWLVSLGIGSVLLAVLVLVVAASSWRGFGKVAGDGDSAVVANSGRGNDPNQKIGSIPTLGDAASVLQNFKISASRDKGSFQPLSELVPLLNGDHIRFSVRLSEPAYVRLLWIDAAGEPVELYPDDPEAGDRGEGPVTSLESPSQLDRGWPLEGSGGIETALLLVSREPLKDVELDEFRTGLPAGIKTATVTRFVATRSDKAVSMFGRENTRSLGKKAHQVDDIVLQLLERIRQHADVTEAVTIPHQSPEN